MQAADNRTVETANRLHDMIERELEVLEIMKDRKWKFGRGAEECSCSQPDSFGRRGTGMRNYCIDCHFLVKHTTAYGVQPWDKEDRLLWQPKGNRDDEYLANIPAENRSVFRVYKVGCYRDEWDSPYEGFTKQSLKEEILKKRERTVKCNFGDYQEGMSFPDAEDLFRVSREIEYQKSTLSWQKIGAAFAFLAFLAALISIYLQSSTP